MPKVIAFHMILTAYGMWLPNDPRGSRSTTIRCRWLREHGHATTVTATRSHAADHHNGATRLAAKDSLRHPAVNFTGTQARAIANGLHDAVDEATYEIWALSIMPDHVHILLAAHPKPVEQIAAHLKSKATRKLNDLGLHPLAGRGTNGRSPSPWARNYWCPFVRDARHLRAVRRYVELNPVKAGLKEQRWRMIHPLPEQYAAKPRRIM
ncbi:MAG: transposase [Planctomycetota bacterium]